MSIALLPPIKPQILEVGHDTDCRRIYTLLSSTQKVVKVQSNTGPNLVIYIYCTYVHSLVYPLFGSASG